MILEHLQRHWDSHLASFVGAGSFMSLQGFNLGSLLQSVLVGVLIFIGTSGLKFLYAKINKLM